MKRGEVNNNIGALVQLNNSGDLLMSGDVRPFMGEPIYIVKLSRGGMVLLVSGSGKNITLPPKNIDLYEG